MRRERNPHPVSARQWCACVTTTTESPVDLRAELGKTPAAITPSLDRAVTRFQYMAIFVVPGPRTELLAVVAAGAVRKIVALVKELGHDSL